MDFACLASRLPFGWKAIRPALSVRRVRFTVKEAMAALVDQKNHTLTVRMSASNAVRQIFGLLPQRPVLLALKDLFSTRPSKPVDVQRKNHILLRTRPVSPVPLTSTWKHWNA